METRQCRGAGASLGYTADTTCLCNTRVASTEPKDDGGGLPRLFSIAPPLLDRTVKPASGTVTSGGHLVEGKEAAGARTGRDQGAGKMVPEQQGDDCY